jgi:hypothetical protein
MSKPIPLRMNMGNSTKNMYQPKLFKVCVMMIAHTGAEVNTVAQGTARGGGFCK